MAEAREGHAPAEEPLGRRERKKLETRRRISHAAFELFQEKGYEATTVGEIAERADVGKGTVFNYFPQKRAFLAALAEEWTAHITQELGPVESWTGSPRDQLKRVFRLTADLSVQHRELSRLVIFEAMREVHAGIAEDPPPGNPPVVHLEALAQRVVIRGQAAGEIRQEVDPAQAASIIGAAVFDTLVRWLVRGGSVEEMQASISGKLDIIFTGLAP